MSVANDAPGLAPDVAASARGLSDGPDVEVVPAVAAVGLTKHFPGVLANDRIDFTVRAGEVHALLGENGSGKTTLCKVLTGLYRPDAGHIAVDGQPVTFSSPADAHRRGLFMVHQHFSLVERLTVAENMVLGWPEQTWRFNPSATVEIVAAAAERFHFAVNPQAQVGHLSVGERQRVEILKALFRGARTLILDEPTAVLTPQESEKLFESMRALADDGGSIVFISHKLNEVLSVSDRVSVLRAGRHTGTVEIHADGGPRVDVQHLSELMVGRHVQLGRRSAKPSVAGVGLKTDQNPALEVVGLSAMGDHGELALTTVSLEVRPGEIVGVAGVAGNGQRELADAICGLRPRTTGRVLVDGIELSPGPKAASRRGVAYVPEDRLATGLAPGLTINENLALKTSSGGELTWGPFLRFRRARLQASQLIEKFAIKGTVDTRVGQLSGGNAQKVLLARELSSAPRVLVVAAPTRGLDIGATDFVRRALIEAADGGLAVLMLSEDLDEVFDLSERIAVMYRGTIAGVVATEEADRERIGMLMMGVATT